MGCFVSKSTLTIRGKSENISPQVSTRELLEGELLDRADYALIQNITMLSNNRPNLRIKIPLSFYHQNDLTIHSLSNYHSSYSSYVI